VFAQSKLSSIDVGNVTSFNNPYELEEHFFNLPKLKISNYKIHFRFNFYSAVIDVYSNDSISYEGLILNQVYKMKSIKPEGQEFPSLVPDQYVYEITQLDKEFATKIGRMVFKAKIYTIPSTREINKWSENWSDCGGVNFQFKIGEHITEAAYKCPWEQTDEKAETKTLQRFFEIVRANLYQYKYYEIFQSKLERDKSYSDGVFTFYKD